MKVTLKKIFFLSTVINKIYKKIIILKLCSIINDPLIIGSGCLVLFVDCSKILKVSIIGVEYYWDKFCVLILYSLSDFAMYRIIAKNFDKDTFQNLVHINYVIKIVLNIISFELKKNRLNLMLFILLIKLFSQFKVFKNWLVI